MTNDEIRMNNAARMTNDEILMTNQCSNDPMTKKGPWTSYRFWRDSSLGLRHYFVIRILSFVIFTTAFLILPSASAQTNSAIEKVAGSYNAFGLKLLAQTRQSVPGRNVFLSPAGLAFALSMAANGAQGETLRQILATLQQEAGAPDLNEANQALLEHLSKLDSKIKLEIANSLWTARDVRIKPAFLAVSRQFYEAEVASVDFTNPATAQKINDWCSDHTHGKIPKMVEPPLDANRLIILDAIYFKGDWIVPFDKKLTRDLPFTLGNGQTVTHPRMSRTGDFQYYEDDAFQAVRLPYAGRAVSMYVFLPKKSLAGFLQNLTMENWEQWTAQFRSRKGTVELPRFKLENDYDLKGVLEALGMPAAFTRQANFHGISDEPLYIDWVKQKTYVDVNEEGTEAAAVSGIGMRALAVRQEEPPFRMVVDRPFFLAIRENQSGAMLFLGAIVDPR
jgi:serpin B